MVEKIFQIMLHNYQPDMHTASSTSLPSNFHLLTMLVVSASDISMQSDSDILKLFFN
jgi:hypothetical protein